jgi:hypothetical protein
MNAPRTVEDFEKLFGKRTVADYPMPRPRRIFVLPLGPMPTFAPMEEGRCCVRAERIPCVCRASWRCQEHGTVCVGSHD